MEKRIEMMYNYVEENDTRVEPSGPLIVSATTDLSMSVWLQV